MKVKFLFTRETLHYGLVMAGDVIECNDEDGEAFCGNGVAVEYTDENEENGVGDNG